MFGINQEQYVMKPKGDVGLGDDIKCEKCGKAALDTGLECSECGHDNYKAVTGKNFTDEGART